MISATLTGHRPERLGYPELDFETSTEWRRIINWLKEKILEMEIVMSFVIMKK